MKTKKINVSKFKTIIIYALENERHIDSQYIQNHPERSKYLNIPNYKIMKVVPLIEKHPLIFPFVLKILPITIFFSAPLLWMLSFIGCLFKILPTEDDKLIFLLSTSKKSNGLIRDLLSNGYGSSNHLIDLSNNLFILGRLLGLKLLLNGVLIHIGVLFEILRRKKSERIDLLFHAIDSYRLILMSLIVSSVGKFVITDDHYQRWSFVFSHLARDLRLVQHGFLDKNLEFPNKYGSINILYLRHINFLSQFKRLYSVNQFIIFCPNLKGLKIKLGFPTILLASSFPSINIEIQYVEQLRSLFDVNIIAQFHPNHIYNNRKVILNNLVDSVCCHPKTSDCSLFISYNSFMEYDYRQAGIPVISIRDIGGYENAVTESVRILKLTKVSNKKREVSE